MNRNAIVAIVLFILVGGVGFYLFQYNQPKNTVPQTSPETQETPTDSESVQEFTVVGTNFAFEPKQMKVKKGDQVRVTFKNNEGVHDLVINEFKASTKQIRAGETTTVEFVADKVGTFEFFCSVGDHRQLGMVGKLVVE